MNIAFTRPAARTQVGIACGMMHVILLIEGLAYRRIDNVGLKRGKNDRECQITSEHIIHATNELNTHLALLLSFSFNNGCVFEKLELSVNYETTAQK